MKSIFIAATPNSEVDDVRLASKLLELLFFKKGTPSVPPIPYFPEKTLYYNSGRAALVEALKACLIGQGDEVIIQAFTCVAIPKSVMFVGAVPIFADTDKSTYNLELESLAGKINEKTRAIIIQNTFGININIEAVRQLIKSANIKRSRSRKVYLIEDCAHNLGSQYSTGESVGKAGDISFFSFGQDKIISTTQGGAALTTDPILLQRLQENYKNLTEPTNAEIRKLLLHIIVWDKIKKYYYSPALIKQFSIGKMIYQISKIFNLTNYIQNAELTETGAIHIHRLASWQKILLVNQLEKLEKFNKNRHAITQIYNKKLDAKSRLNIDAPLLRYPVIVENPPAIHNAFKKYQIITGNWYNSTIYPASIDASKLGYKKDCPNAEYIAKHIVNLPTNIDINEIDAAKIAEIFNSACTTQ